MSVTSDRLQLYLDAEAKILAGQSVTWENRTLTRADLRWVQAGITQLKGELANENRAAAGQGRAGVSMADFSR